MCADAVVFFRGLTLSLNPSPIQGEGLPTPMRMKLSGLPICKAEYWGLQPPQKCFCFVTTHGVQMALQSHANQGYIRIQGQKSPFSMDYAAKKTGTRRTWRHPLARRLRRQTRNLAPLVRPAGQSHTHRPRTGRTRTTRKRTRTTRERTGPF